MKTTVQEKRIRELEDAKKLIDATIARLADVDAECDPESSGHAFDKARDQFREVITIIDELKTDIDMEFYGEKRTEERTP